MKERIAEMWQYLLQKDPLSKGYVKSLVDPAIQVPVYLAIIFPTRDKALLIDYAANARSIPEPFVGRGMKLEWLSEPENQKSRFVMLTLTNTGFSEVFDVLVEDCIQSIVAGSNKSASLKAFSNRLNTWRNLLETYSDSGLTLSAQQGLFGELIVLLRLLKAFPEKSYEVLTAWQGPDQFRQDFQYNNWAIEVKTTTGSDSVNIANETQLSLVGLRHLYLWHLVLDPHKGQGANLNNLVAEVRSYIKADTDADELLNVRLAAIGYYVHQSVFYEHAGYFLRQQTIYNVQEDFPTLTIKNIPVGIDEVKYTLHLSACASFIIQEKDVYSTLML